MKRKISLYLMVALYAMAGINHFVNPVFYYRMVPPWIGNAAWVNTLAGIAELVLAVLLLFKNTRKWACFGIIAMLLAFVPTHIYMLQDAFCATGPCPPAWILWVRLLVLQPLLILWAWKNRNV
ncbi:MAG: hypothetical protein EOO03_03340 [Chitinophagaceae bacterium]|nr:MAG: hypothetical protein EOO03_03340 [Chitinophagaceae bacterium]